ncbi:hypothetical protein Godav_018226 [Gossypium davidsonii]|uniref:Uncharacterized protein n=2 Tax=Gossypium TaxID=3633 RepID=A0A7J8QWL6_GOSDV|nr:hypothetical protein [Gossypium davidsonii]MBA0640617.1 hypothetical protein [Gossypium klotzschianum]
MEARRSVNPHVDRQYLDTPYRDVNCRNLQNNHVPNFQRPLLRKHIAGRMSAGRRKSFDDCQLSLGEMSSYVEVPASLSDALSEGLSLSSDWSARHLDDPHHKVAQAALSTLVDIIPSCQEPFESYMERILTHVFLRLIDPKELDSGRLARKRQLLTKIALRNRLIAFVVNGIATCRVLEQGLLRSYGVKTQGVDNGRGAVDLIAFGAFGAKFDLMMTGMILLILNGLKATLHIKK